MLAANSTNSKQLISQLNCALSPTDALCAIAAISASETTEVAVISALVQLLSRHHHHSSVATAAVEVLVKLAPASVEPLLAAYRCCGDQGFQAWIIQALAMIGDAKAFDLLAEVVGTEVANHCQGNVRRIAARGLGKIGSTVKDREVTDRAVEKLHWALVTPQDWGLRYAAVVSLQEIATPQAYAVLSAGVACESDRVVRSRMKKALERIPAS